MKFIPCPGHLEPGRMFLVDLEKGVIVSDDQIKEEISSRFPYSDWLLGQTTMLKEISVDPKAVSDEVKHNFGFQQWTRG